MGEVDRTGTVIDGRYAVERLLARGGFSAVYRARRVADAGIFAVKVLELAGASATAIERFSREAEVLAELRSPHTVRIVETGQVGAELMFSVLEYIPGRSLHSQVQKHGPLNPRQIAEVTVQICASIGEAHEHGLLHRDLKPTNVMLFRSEEQRVMVKVLDFGIAKRLEAPGTPGSGPQLTAAGAFVGTPRYASPEQMRREPLTAASDIYAIGLIMWEALLGEPAVVASDYSGAVKAHISLTPWQLPDSRGLPPELVRIVEKTLAKSADQRYQSCGELTGALHHFLQLRTATN